MKNLAPLLALLLSAPGWAEPPKDLQPLLGTFEKYAEKSLQEWGTPGMAVAIVVGDEMVYSHGFGVRKAGSNLPVTPETVFQIGSISKSFTSTLVGHLVDQKKCSWTDRVINHYPEFRLYDAWVTRAFMLEDTMSQRSGMPPYAGDALAFMGKSRDEILAAMRFIEPVSSARTQFAYVNNLWLASAKVIEKATGLSWEEAVSQKIFSPLAMTSSSTGLAGLFGSTNHAWPHLSGPKGAVPLEQNWPFAKWVYTYGPAGGINSNVLDMAKYARLHLHGQVAGQQILSPESLEKLHTPHIYAGGQSARPALGIAQAGRLSYCLGWLRQECSPSPIVWHNGGTSGCKAVLGVVPDHDIAIVVLSNLGGTDLPEALMYKFYDLYLERPDQDYSANFLKSFKARQPVAPVRPQPAGEPLPLQKYVGNYRNPAYGVAKVEKVGEQLKVSLGGMIWMCSPWNRDSFSFPDFGNPADPPQMANFRCDAQGQVVELEVPCLSDSRAGIFLREP
jgi:CubicO group peptidase (beta-lactamase class C family)